MAEKTKQKKAFKMPHLFWIMVFLLLIISLLTYVIPAGRFGTTEAGTIDGNAFQFLGHQTPVSPLAALMMIMNGMTGSALVGYSVMLGGASVGVVMATGAFDNFLDWAVYKLQDKDNVLIVVMFILMVYLGSFGGSDALIAIVPVGVMFAKKLKLDPICAIGITTYATLLGFGTGPTKQMTTQMLMGVQIYGTFGTMFISMNVFMIVGLIFLLLYTNKIKKDPTKSLMWDSGWRPEEGEVDTSSLKEVKLTWRTVAVLIVYFGQYVILVGYPLWSGDTSKTFPMIYMMAIIVSIACGFLGGFSFDKIGNEFAKGLSSMAFVAFVIGFARVMSDVMGAGNILHTIVYWLTRPLMGKSLGIASVGMTIVIAVVNLIIPSASSKAAILVPILKPISEALGMMGELAVQAFQYGDGFSNMVSPFLGWTVGSCVTAGVEFTTWVKWVLPKVLCFIALGCVIIFMLSTMGWTPF